MVRRKIGEYWVKKRVNKEFTWNPISEIVFSGEKETHC